MSDVSKKSNCNGGPDPVANNQSSNENQSGQSNSQSNVRYIPITLDYDDKTVNTENRKSTEKPAANPANTTKPSSGRYQHSNHFANDPQKPSSIFDRVKHFPVNLRPTQTRNESPGRTIPITVQTDCGKSSPQSGTSPKPATTPKPATSPTPAASSPNPAASSPKPDASSPRPSNTHDEVDSATDDNAAIAKIQVIQREVQCLLEKVEIFDGTRKDKDYMYLDEMLTQNLLKLDRIEADGREIIKQARREAIKCVNTCIAVLEAKAEKGNEQKSDDKSQVKSEN